MLQYAADVNRTVKGLAAVVENQHPLVKMLIDNWALTGVAGTALGIRFWRQHKAGQLSFWQGVQDAGVVIAPLVSIFILMKIAQERDVEQSIARAAYGAGMQRGGAVEAAVPPQQVPHTGAQVLGRIL